MNNLTQTQYDAKEAYLNQQSAQMLKMYNVADADERKAIANHIYGFPPIVSEEAKIFCLKFLNNLEKINEMPKVLFPLGEVFLTIGVRQALYESNQLSNEFLTRHQSGDYGLICEEDKKENDLSIKEGFRILSAYKTLKDGKIWIITEADRSITTLLLPEEY